MRVRKTDITDLMTVVSVLVTVLRGLEHLLGKSNWEYWAGVSLCPVFFVICQSHIEFPKVHTNIRLHLHKDIFTRKHKLLFADAPFFYTKKMKMLVLSFSFLSWC